MSGTRDSSSSFATVSSTDLSSSSISTLHEQINASSSLAHSQLNRLITARLQLALPPNAATPSIYMLGLLHIAPLYHTLESLWQSILESPTSNSSDLGPEDLAKASTRVRSTLRDLHLPGLLRSERIRADIMLISGSSEGGIDEKLKEVSKTGKVAEFQAHMRKSVRINPHVLLAYAWVLYMALFSGGRYIRASLQHAGPNFLPIPCGQTALRVDCIQFFCFDGGEDGEDTKREFKKRFIEADNLMNDLEKKDIIHESQNIFHFMIEIVEELDETCRTNDNNKPDPTSLGTKEQ